PESFQWQIGREDELSTAAGRLEDHALRRRLFSRCLEKMTYQSAQPGPDFTAKALEDRPEEWLNRRGGKHHHHSFRPAADRRQPARGLTSGIAQRRLRLEGWRRRQRCRPEDLDLCHRAPHPRLATPTVQSSRSPRWLAVSTELSAHRSPTGRPLMAARP